MRILVTAPATRIGQRILRELLAPEFSVRVLMRDPACLPRQIQRQVQVFRGSHGDTAALTRALDGVEALFWRVPREWLNETEVQRQYERFAHAGTAAIRRAGTPRVVTISEDSEGIAMENILNDSGAAIRHLRYSVTDITNITDAALRWLARRDWKGIQSITVSGSGAPHPARSVEHPTTTDTRYEYDTEEISRA